MHAKKFVLISLVTVLVLFTLAFPASARVENQAARETPDYSISGGIAPRFYSETSSAVADIWISGNKVSAAMSVKARKTSTKISGTLYLEKQTKNGWGKVTSWSVSGTGTLNATNSYAATSGTTYRSRFVVTVGSETVERSSGSCSY